MRKLGNLGNLKKWRNPPESPEKNHIRALATSYVDAPQDPNPDTLHSQPSRTPEVGPSRKHALLRIVAADPPVFRKVGPLFRV